MTSPITVKMWGTTIGKLGYLDLSGVATFEFSDAIFQSNFEISPVLMPNRQRRHSFRDISERTFKGLPGVFADSLPDTFGNQLIDLYMAEKGIPSESVTALDRLLYVGQRGMGALEYHPSNELGHQDSPIQLDINTLAELANLVTSRQDDKNRSLLDAANIEQAIKLIRVGSSAGGARSKALIAKSPDGRYFDGTQDHGVDFSYWLMKFDSDENHDRDSNDPKGMPRIEYIYGLMANDCNINVPKIDYLNIGNDFHFMIERFDRFNNKGKLDKLHYASWSGLAHASRDETGAYSYEQLVLLARQMELPQEDVNQIFHRAVFNVVGRNQDDHCKNFGFVAGRDGEWRLSQAFDMTYSYDPAGRWTRQHQIKLNNKQDAFTRTDLIKFGEYCNLSEKQSGAVIDNTLEVFSTFQRLANEYEVTPALKETIGSNLRINELKRQQISTHINDRELKP